MTWLDDHCTTRREAVTRRRSLVPERELQDRAQRQPPPRPFAEALKRGPAPALIAEIKFRSPSRGELRPRRDDARRDVETVARSYERAGATALSVLIDETHFGGHLDFLSRARAAVALPVLAKGFLVHPYDVLEARAHGADAVLLIAACLERTLLAEMHGTARAQGMDALVELHSEADLQKIEGLELPLVGVNHRDLGTLAMDMDLSRRLAPRLPARSLRVAESGLASAEEVARMTTLGYDAVLMGTRFMAHADPGGELRTLLEGRVR